MSAQPIYQPAAPSYRMEVFTPAVAKAILETQNGGNRPIRKRTVDFLASEMTLGEWQPASADAICFDPQGNLINGQHRLSAVVQSGVTVSMLVGRNIPEEAFQVIDRGTKRSTGDDLHKIGATNYNQIAAFVSNYLLACTHGSFDPYHITGHKRSQTKPKRVIEFVKGNWDTCNEIGKYQHYVKALGEPRYIMGALLQIAMCGVPLTEVRTFVKLLDPQFSGEVSNNHPARVASRTLMGAKLGRVKLSFGEVAEIVIRAYNDSVDGESRTQKYIPKKVTPQVKVNA